MNSAGREGAGEHRSAGTRIDPSIDLVGLADMLARRKWVIVLMTVIFIVLALLALSAITPRYAATAQLLIDPREQRFVQNELIQQGMGADLRLIDSQIEIITSEAVLSRVVAENDLASDPEFMPESDGRDPAEIALESLAAATGVTRAENTYVLEITVTTREAAKSARLANAVAKAYIEDQREAAASVARNVSSSIENRLAELRDRLREAEQKVEAYKREHEVTNAEGMLLVERRLSDLSERHAAAAARVTEARTRLAVMEEALRRRGDVGAVISSQDGTMSGLRAELSAAQQRLAELEQVMGPRHPRVATARAEVEQARAAVRAESERLVADARDDYQAAADTVAELQSDLEAATAASFETNSDLIRLRELEREAQSSRVVYETYLVRAKETAEQEKLTAPNARVIAPASVPERPSFPPKLPLLAAAVLLGLGAGVFIAIVLDLFAGARAARKASAADAAPLAAGATPLAAGATVADRLVMVFALDDPDMARRGALEIARDAAEAGRRAVFLDLAADASPTVAGLADLAMGEMPAEEAVRIGSVSGLHMLNAGRADALAAASTADLERGIEAISREYAEIVVNSGSLDGDMGKAAEAFAARARHAILVVAAGHVGPDERRAVEALWASGLHVSIVSVDGEHDVNQVA